MNKKAKNRITQAAEDIGFVPIIEWEEDVVIISEEGTDFKVQVPIQEVTENDFGSFKSDLAFFYNELE